MTKQRTVKLTVLPSCDFCILENPLSTPQIARSDAPTASGWAYLCYYHFKGYALSQGTKLEAEDEIVQTTDCPKCGTPNRIGRKRCVWCSEKLEREDSLESGAVEQEIVFARQRLAKEGT